MEPIGWQGKLRFHAVSAYGPAALAGALVYDGFLQGINYPREWGPGGLGYGKRLGSTLAYAGVRNLLGFGLDSALHQDPRYYRSTERGMWRRSTHAFRETILTHKDSGGETLATWRLGSAYGAAFISNRWYPDRVNTVALGFSQGRFSWASICYLIWARSSGPTSRENCSIASLNFNDHPRSLDGGSSSP